MGHKLSPAGGWAVDAVMAESPAEEAGILQGERILEIGEPHHVGAEGGALQACIKPTIMSRRTALTLAAQCLQGGTFSERPAFPAAAALQTLQLRSQGIIST